MRIIASRLSNGNGNLREPLHTWSELLLDLIAGGQRHQVGGDFPLQRRVLAPSRSKRPAIPGSRLPDFALFQQHGSVFMRGDREEPVLIGSFECLYRRVEQSRRRSQIARAYFNTRQLGSKRMPV